MREGEARAHCTSVGVDWAHDRHADVPSRIGALPHTPLPLRVFEPRYLRLMGELLDSDDPQFGVVLIDRGHETGGGDQRSGIGTLARLVDVAAGADALQVVAIGTDRFTVDRWLDDDPYPRAEVSLQEPLVWNDALMPLRTEAEAIVRRVLGRFPDAPWGAHIELSSDPVAAAWQIAAIAPWSSTTSSGCCGQRPWEGCFSRSST
jgi:Lon protease-like protein